MLSVVLSASLFNIKKTIWHFFFFVWVHFWYKILFICDSTASSAEIINWLCRGWCKAPWNEKVTLIIILMMELSASLWVVLWSLCRAKANGRTSSIEMSANTAHTTHSATYMSIADYMNYSNNVWHTNTHAPISPSALTHFSGIWESSLSPKNQFLPLNMNSFEGGCWKLLVGHTAILYEVLTTQQNVSFMTYISSQQRDARVNASKMDTVSPVVEVRRRVIQYNGLWIATSSRGAIRLLRFISKNKC